MSKQSTNSSAHMERAPQSEQLFPVEREYARCVTALNCTGILTLLPKSGKLVIENRTICHNIKNQVI